MTAHPIDEQAEWGAHMSEIGQLQNEYEKVVNELSAAEHRATRAETRIKAVEDVLDDGTCTGLSSGKDWVSATAIRRALGNDHPPSV